MRKLDGQVVLITGASSGIGRAAAQRLCRDGASVVAAARRLDHIEAVKRELREQCSRHKDAVPMGQLDAVRTDVTSPSDRDKLIQHTMDIYGRIDVLINNAGQGLRGPVELVPLEGVRQNFETNLFSLIALTQLVTPIMRRQHAGHIINISSVAGRVALPFSSIYDATKHALEAVSDGLRGELAPFGIKVIVIQPGYINTEFSQVADEASRSWMAPKSVYTPLFSQANRSYKRLKRFAGSPDDIAEIIARVLLERVPRPRYAVPSYAQVVLILRQLLPRQLFDWLINR